jgi:outer membrane biosynthesis protein TonB
MNITNHLIYCVSLSLIISVSSAHADSTHEMDEKVREAVVAELTRVQQEQLDNSLKQVEQRQADTAAEKQNQLQQMLKLTVAKAVIDNTPAKPAQKESSAKETSPEEQTASQTETTSQQKAPHQKIQKIEEKPQEAITQAKQATPNKKAPEQTASKQAASNTTIEKNTPKRTTNSSEQWIYLGQYTSGSWEEKTINIENGALPNTGASYTLNQSVNVRNGLPAKKQMPKVITALASNDKIDLIELKKSGKNGHYWGRVSY